ncbi:MAG: ABC transporter ATP-binding protein [Candidatus Bathyarchaeia archaeon]
MVNEVIIEVKGLVKHYGDVKALDDVSFIVEEGEIFGLLGPNGAGKTTLIEILCGLRRFDKGEITVLGFDLAKNSYKIRGLIGFCPQETLLYDLLSVYENLGFVASLYSLPSKKFKERLEFASKALGVNEFLKKRARELSGGMKRRANLAASIIHDPPIVILDEPTVGFDPNIKREFWETIKLLKREGKTVLLSTHDMYEADALCDRVAIMDKGKIVAIDKPQVLKDTLGGKASICIRVKESHSGKALELLKPYGYTFRDGDIQIFADNPWKIMPEISNVLLSNKVLTEKIEVLEPTLEDVFVRLTGRKLLEEES